MSSSKFVLVKLVSFPSSPQKCSTWTVSGIGNCSFF